MAITVGQKVQVAKDRAADELNDLISTAHGYWNLDQQGKRQVKHIAKLISLPDDSPETLRLMDSYINGEEEMFFSPQ
jgi:hypothetical protein